MTVPQVRKDALWSEELALVLNRAGVRFRQEKAEMPVISRPRISDWMESVPS
jgi:hypothetical protein